MKLFDGQFGQSAVSRRRGGGGPAIDTTPMAARRSIRFPFVNGVAGHVCLALPPVINFFGTGSTAQVHEFLFRVNLNPQSHRGFGSGGVANGNNLTQDLQIMGLTTSSALHVRVGGVHSTNDGGLIAGRIRVRLGIPGAICYSPLLWTDGSGNWRDLPSDDFLVRVRTDGTSAWVTLHRSDGSVEDGTAVSLAGWNGIATLPTINVGASTNAPGLGNGISNGALSDLTLVRRALTTDEALRISRGEDVPAVLGSFSGFHYRMSGVNDLDKSSGTDSMGALTLVDNGQATAGLFRLHSGGTIGGAANAAGTNGVQIEHIKLWFGCVFAPDPATGLGAVQVPIINTGTLASHYEARLLLCPLNNSNPTTATTPWVRITSSPLAPGARTIGLVPDVLGPWKQVEVRSENDSTIRAASMRTGVGPVFPVHGQSEREFGFNFQIYSENVALRETLAPQAATNMVSYVKMQCRSTASTYTPRARVERAPVEGIAPGYGITALAKDWSARYPNICMMLINFAVSGQPRTTWTTNANMPSTTYPAFGTLGVANSGEVADIHLAAFPDPTKWPTTGEIFYPSLAESSTAATAKAHFDAYFYGIGSPARSFNTLFSLRTSSVTRIAVVPHGRGFDAVASATNAQLATQITGWINKTNGVVQFTDATPPSGYVVTRMAPNNVVLFQDTGDTIHPGTAVTRAAGTVSGRAWFELNFIHAMEHLAGLNPAYTPSALSLPSTFSRAIPDTGTTLTIALPSSSLGNWSRRAGSGPMDRLWLISTDAGATYRQLVQTPTSVDADIAGTATVSGNVVTIECASLSTVSNANLRVLYFQQPMCSSAGTNPQYATETAARRAENDLIDGALVIADPRFDPTIVVGYPLYDHNKVLTAA